MLDACPAVESLSTIVALVPPATSVVFVAVITGGSPEATRSELGKRRVYTAFGFSLTPTNRMSGPPVAVAPVTVHPAPVVAVGIVASKVKLVAVAEATVCIPPLITATSAAVQLLPVLAATPERVTISLVASVLLAVTVTTVVDAVIPVTVNTWVL